MSALTKIDPTPPERGSDTADQLALIRTTYARDFTQPEFDLLTAEATARGLSILNKELIGVKVQGKVTAFLTLAGVRKLAERSGAIRGVEGPYWRGKTGPWTDAWVEDAPPAAAKFLVYRYDSEMPYVGIAIWKERAQYSFKEGARKLTATWAAMPALMLGKVAESDAYKRARVVADLDVAIEEDEEERPKTRVTVAKQAAMAHAHQAGTHAQVKQVVRALNPSATGSLADEAVTPQDLDVAGDALAEFGPDAAEIIAEPPADEFGEPSDQELWVADVKEAFADWNREAYDYLRERLAGAAMPDDEWMHLETISRAPTKAIRDRFVDIARAANVSEAMIDAAMQTRQDAAQTQQAAQQRF